MENIRNFVIISHIDHGKSTLADRFLELTETVSKEKMKPQYLDMMDLERERGITIKMQPVRMLYEHPQIQNSKFKNQKENKELYILNLIDTPGHVDFSYEVSRSLAAVEGAILLVDATKGIQAQTLANLELAKGKNLTIIPVINKIDLVQARVKETKEELSNLLSVAQNEILEISAKQGTRVEEILEAVIKKIPCPVRNINRPFRALIFDSRYDFYKGVIAYLRVFDGKIKKGERICLIQGKTESEVKELGFFKPEMRQTEELKAGEIGYLATGIKEPGKVRVGDTISKLKIKNEKLKINEYLLEALPGYQEPKPMVFASIYPENPDDFDRLKESLAKLKLNDASLIFEPEMKEGLGRGFLCGFLGTLHAEIVSQRLFREYDLNLIISTASVNYKIIDKKDREIFIKSATDWPENSQIKEAQEPFVNLEVITPLSFLGKVFEVLKKIDGKQIQTKYFGEDKILLTYETPLREIITGFYDNLKNISQGFASMNYQILDYRKTELIKLEIFVAGRKQEAFSKIVPREKAYQEGKKIVEKLKEILPAQLFSVPLQAVVSDKVIARETMRARGKDVIAPLYGGDYTRKRKLLERQKRGKKELKEKGEVQIPQSVFLEIWRSK